MEKLPPESGCRVCGDDGKLVGHSAMVEAEGAKD